METAMSLDDLIEQLCVARSQSQQTRSVLIAIERPGTVGATPAVPIASAAAGFDWDSAKVLLRPARPLVAVTPEQLADIRASVRKGQSWHAYQTYKKQSERIEELEREVQRLQELLGGGLAGEQT
jgi:hypothetical protein